ncbi:MAG TPA: hypothetical protein VFJ82_18045 [Longimicrobium sp.]|nr:hypothetical protein [Longimicrobium sp.]
MSTVRVDPSPGEPAPDAPAPAKPARGLCGNCGFADTGTYCSRCGEPLHGTRETVLQILWGDLVEGPLHNGLALAKTTWLMLVRPRRFFDGVLRRQHGMTHVPFFLASLWRRVSRKPHGVPNSVRYFVLIYTLSVLGTWVARVNVFQEITTWFLGPFAVLPGGIADALFLVFVVFAALMYSRAMSLLLGGRIETELLTRFMLYLNGFALIPFTGMSMAGTRHPVVFVASLVFWLYVLIVLPHLALPRIFGVSRARLGFAQGGSAVVNLAGLAAMVFCAGAAADLLKPGWRNPTRSGITAVRDASRSVLPVDTMATVIGQFPQLPLPPGVTLPARQPARPRGPATPAPTR